MGKGICKKKDGVPTYNHPNTRKVCITTHWIWPRNASKEIIKLRYLLMFQGVNVRIINISFKSIETSKIEKSVLN